MTRDSNQNDEGMDSSSILEGIRHRAGALVKLQQEQPKLRSRCKPANLADVEYPYVCYTVSGQDNACLLTAPANLPQELAGLYRIDAGLTNLYAREASLIMGVQACYYWFADGNTPSITVTGISSMRFSDTRPNTPTSQHNFGKAFDVKLAGLMLTDGTSYDAYKCALVCLCGALAGATRVFFSDQQVVDAVNQVLRDNGRPAVCQNIADHRNHIHFDNR
jgi:hypothetical protein